MPAHPVMPSLEHEVVCLCCGGPNADAIARLQRLAAMPIHWRTVLDIAEAHAVGPALAARLVTLNFVIDAELRPAIQRMLVDQTAFNAPAIAELRTVLDLLTADGIAAASFKGPVFAAMAFGHAGARGFSDLDILVLPASIADARRCLLANGFTLAKSDILSVYPSAGSEETFLPARTGWLPIEMQSRPWKWPLALRLDTRDLIARRQSIAIGGHTLATLATEDLVLVMAIHGLYHGWTHLRFIADVDAVVRLDPQWPIVIERAKEARAGRIVSLALLVAHGVLRTDAGPALEWARQDTAAVALAQRIGARLFRPITGPLAHPWKDWIRCRSREHLSDKLRYCVRTLAAERVIWPIDRIRAAFARRSPPPARARGAAPR